MIPKSRSFGGKTYSAGTEARVAKYQLIDGRYLQKLEKITEWGLAF